MKNGNKTPNKQELERLYNQYAEERSFLAKDVKDYLETILSGLSTHPTIKSRTKNFSSYFRKYLRLLRYNGSEQRPPLITDLIGIRIICPFIEDLQLVEQVLREQLEVIEVERKGSNHSFKEFGYESTHLLIKIPGKILAKREQCDCSTAEIQIRTILQDAWAEVEHELVYKTEFNPFDNPMKRKLAAVNASLSLADIIFQEIRDYQRQLNSQLTARRESFFKKIENSTDARLFSQISILGEKQTFNEYMAEAGGESIDELLLSALYAHNKNQFDTAIDCYSRILYMNPDDSIKSLIYKHRGMANFAQSKYEDAVEDFSSSFALEPDSYKSLYYRAVVRSVLEQYQEAIEDYTLSLSINPYQGFCLYRRSQAHYHIEDYPKALADCEAALALEPGLEAVAHFRALLIEKLKM